MYAGSKVNKKVLVRVSLEGIRKKICVNVAVGVKYRQGWNKYCIPPQSHVPLTIFPYLSSRLVSSTLTLRESLLGEYDEESVGPWMENMVKIRMFLPEIQWSKSLVSGD